MFPDFEKFTLMTQNETTTSYSTGNNTVLCKGCPTDKEIRAAATDSTMHQTKTDRWAIDMMQLFFEKGARWAITKISSSPTVGQRSVGQSGRVGCVHNTLKYIGPWYSCEDCGTHFSASAEAPSEGALDF